MAREGISDVVVMHPHRPMRMLLHGELTRSGYTAAYAPSYTAVLRRLRRAADPVVVLVGNWQSDFHAEQGFFRRVAADPELARRHRFVLYCALPEWMPMALEATLRGLGVTVLPMPCLAELRDAVAVAAGRAHAPYSWAG